MDGPGTDPLLLGLAAGDQRAFAVLYDRFAPRMYRAALSMLGCREDAEDAVQNVFLSMVRSRKRLGKVQDLAAYLFTALRRAATRCAAQRSRAVVTSTAAEEATASAEPPATDGVDWHRVRKALDALPERQREVLSLKIDGELTLAQIAEVTGVSVSTVASRYHYALRKLKTSLSGAEKLSGEQNSGSRLLLCERSSREPSGGIIGKWITAPSPLP